MDHRRAKLTPFGRLLIAEPVLELGGRWRRRPRQPAVPGPPPTSGSFVTGSKGLAGLEDRSSRPRRCPPALPARQARRILRARRRLRQGPHQLAPVIASPRHDLRGAPGAIR